MSFKQTLLEHMDEKKEIIFWLGMLSTLAGCITGIVVSVVLRVQGHISEPTFVAIFLPSIGFGGVSGLLGAKAREETKRRGSFDDH